MQLSKSEQSGGVLRVDAKRFLERFQRAFGPSEKIMKARDRDSGKDLVWVRADKIGRELDALLSSSRGDMRFGPFVAEFLLIAAQAKRRPQCLHGTGRVPGGEQRDSQIAPAFEVARVLGDDLPIYADGFFGLTAADRDQSEQPLLLRTDERLVAALNRLEPFATPADKGESST